MSVMDADHARVGVVGAAFRDAGERVALVDQAPALASALPAELRTYALTFPLEPAAWHPIRAACVAVMQRHPERPLVRWLPGLAELDALELLNDGGLPPGVARLPPRIHHALLEDLIGWGRARTWADLGRLSVLDLGRVSGVGAASLPVLLETIVDVGARCRWTRTAHLDDGDEPLQESVDETASDADAPGPGAAEAQEPTPEAVLAPRLAPLVPLLATVGAWAVVELGVRRIEEALALAASDEAPPEVREAVDLLRSASFPTLPSPDVGGLIDALLASLPEARRVVFEARVLQPSGGTLEAIGARLGVTRERVRQVEVAARHGVTQMLAEPRYRWLRWRVHRLRHELGGLVPAGHPFAREALDAALGPAATERQVAFLLWAAGPYDLRDGMWVAEARRGAGADVRLLAAIPDEGLTDDELAAAFTEVGIPTVFRESVMAWLPRVERLLGRWFRGSLAISDYAAAALSHLGRPATIEEIVDITGMDRDPRSVANRIQADERFVRASKDAYALRAWGVEEYAGIADAIARAIEARGGSARVPDLMREISGAFNVNPGSVRAYADAPMFVLEGDTVRMRRPDEPYVVADQLPSRRRTYRYGPVIVIVLDVGGDVLRGSGSPLQGDVTQALGVAPGTVRRFEGEDFEVTVSWPMTGWTGGSIGSLRGAVASAGATAAHRLRLSFHVGDRTVRAVAIDDAVLHGMEPRGALRRLTGAPGSTWGDVIASLASALRESESRLEAALRARGDHDVADLVQRGLACRGTGFGAGSASP